MIVLSYNIKGLGSAHKRNSLKRSVLENNLEVILIQEMILEAYKAKGLLLATIPGWIFEAISSKGRSRGLVVGWYKTL
jgi:hypothetical protein